eukprot:12792636-Alexandrium_andersonii.AAC.1
MSVCKDVAYAVPARESCGPERHVQQGGECATHCRLFLDPRRFGATHHYVQSSVSPRAVVASKSTRLWRSTS